MLLVLRLITGEGCSGLYVMYELCVSFDRKKNISFLHLNIPLLRRGGRRPGWSGVLLVFVAIGYFISWTEALCVLPFRANGRRGSAGGAAPARYPRST